MNDIHPLYTVNSNQELTPRAELLELATKLRVAHIAHRRVTRNTQHTQARATFRHEQDTLDTQRSSEAKTLKPQASSETQGHPRLPIRSRATNKTYIRPAQNPCPCSELGPW